MTAYTIAQTLVAAYTAIKLVNAALIGFHLLSNLHLTKGHPHK